MNKMLKAIVITLTFMVTSAGIGILPQTTEAASLTTSKKIVSTAKSYIGKVKYDYNTRNPKRLIFDCSSFTQFIFDKQGIDIPWSSVAQSKLGTRINKSDLRQGDLVFFSVNVPGHIDHVGIYVGNGKFISNTKSSGVVIRELNSGYWKNRYITGRRI